MKHNSLGSNLLKGDLNPKPRFWWNPKFTERFIDKIENEDREWKVPPEWDMLIFHYNDSYHHLNSKYTINRDWEVKSLKWEVMKYFFHPNKRWPRVRLQVRKSDKDWKIIFVEKEIWILQIMERAFGPYIPWYKLKRKSPQRYILVPRNWDYNNIRYDNLHYVRKDENTKKNLMKQYIQSYPNIDDERIANIFNTTQWYVRKAKQELVDEGHLPYFSLYQNIQKEIWIEFAEDSMEIYQLLLQSKWQLKNMEVAKILWPEEIEKAKDKSIYTNKVVRVRKKLTDKWLIPRFNDNFESKREKAVEMIMNKAKTHQTNQDIANVLWLNKTQIDNLARQIKKEKQKKIEN